VNSTPTGTGPLEGLDAEEVFARSRRPLVLGIGGGGDVVGAAAVAKLLEQGGAEAIVGGTTWERRVVDPRPGPRSEDEVDGAARRLARGVLLADGATRVGRDGPPFAEALVARALDRPTLLVDVTLGPRAIARSLTAALHELGCDAVLFVDVGGDAVASGEEPGLASPLCDAMMLAAGAHLAAVATVPVLAAVFGAGCDGELAPGEVLTRVALICAAGAFAGARALGPRAARRLADLCAVVPTEASAQALACFEGARGTATIRGGLRTVELTPLGALCFFFDLQRAFEAGCLPLAAAVAEADDLEAANDVLARRGLRTELDYERRAARGAER